MRIVAENISVVFQNRYVIKNLSYDLKQNTCIKLQGNNGSGKTTLIKVLASWLQPDQGSVHYYAGNNQKISAERFKKKVGLCLTESFLCPDMTLRENLSLYYPKFERDPHVQQCIEQFKLTSKLSQRVGHFSKGEMQKASLCRALMFDPEVLLLDESLQGLDKQTQGFMINLLAQMKGKKSMLLCSHLDLIKDSFFDDIWSLN